MNVSVGKLSSFCFDSIFAELTSHTPRTKKENLHAGRGDTLSYGFQTNYTDAHVIIQANEEREAVFSGVCVVRCTHG